MRVIGRRLEVHHVRPSVHRAGKKRFFSKLFVKRANADKHVNVYKKADDGGREMGRVVFDVLVIFTRLTHQNDGDDCQAAHYYDAHNC